MHRRTLLAVACLLASPACASLVPPADFSAIEAAEAEARAEAEAKRARVVGGIEILGGDPLQAWVTPRFDTVDGPITAGTAFVCQIVPKQPPLLLTAHHLFGPAGGLARDYHWSELGKLVRGAQGYRDPNTIAVVAGPPLTLEGAEGMGAGGVGTDLAALPLVAPAQTHALPLASKDPAVDTPVWLIGPVAGDDELRHRAVVTELGGDYIVYAFDEPITLQATSGAPVVDGDGQVVAVNLGGEVNDGVSFGIGNPASSIRQRILAAMGD